MAGGTIVLAHKSGGPLMDIVTTDPEEERTGYLANDIGGWCGVTSIIEVVCLLVLKLQFF